MSLFIYLFCAAGYVDTIDASPSIDTAQAFLERGKLSFKPQFTWPAVYQRSPIEPEEYVSKMGLLLPVLYLVPVTLGNRLSRDPVRQRHISEFFVSLVNSVLTSLLLSLIYLILIERNFLNSQAILLTTLLGFCTVLWPYAKTCHRETLQALLLVALVWATLKGHWKLAGLSLSLGILTKQAWFVPALPIALWSLYSLLRAKKQRAPFLIMASIGPALLLLSAWYASGSLLFTGYSSDTVKPTGKFWSTPFLTGLHLQVFSWKTGLFAFNPILLAVFPTLFGKFRERRFETFDWVIFSSIMLQFCFYSRWLNPLGGHNLGPRYSVVVLPLFFLFLDRNCLAKFGKPALRFGLIFLTAYSFALQLVFVSVKAQQVHTLEVLSAKPLEEAPWLVQAKLFTNKLKGRPEYYNLSEFGGEDQWVNLSAYRSLQGFNYWWAHLHRYDPEKHSGVLSFFRE